VFAAEAGARALAIFSRRFGPYPFDTFTIAAIPLSSYGLEFPGIIALSDRIFDLGGAIDGVPITALLESLTGVKFLHVPYTGGMPALTGLLGAQIDINTQNFDIASTQLKAGAVRAMREKYAFPVHEGSVQAAPLEEASFDVVTMFDVIEHLHDPFSDVQKIFKLLRPGGGVAISTMDSESLVSRLLGTRLEDFRRIREHLFFFSRESLTKVLESNGFRVYKIASYGHTFELAFLMERMRIINRPIFGAAKWLVKHLGIGRWRVSIDPHTKMIVYAEKPLATGC
jgi:SAM-dependent methyltransferase